MARTAPISALQSHARGPRSAPRAADTDIDGEFDLILKPLIYAPPAQNIVTTVNARGVIAGAVTRTSIAGSDQKKLRPNIVM
jgi:hypothetical protein